MPVIKPLEELSADIRRLFRSSIISKVRSVCFLFEDKRDLRSQSGFTFQFHFCTVMLGTMLYDRKTESRSADLFRVALVDTVESFKYPLLVLLRNADTRICNLQEDLIIFLGNIYGNTSSRSIVFHRVITKVKDHFAQKLIDTVYENRASGQFQRDPLFIGNRS